MTLSDVGFMAGGIGLMAAFVDAATGCQIARALRKVLRGKTPHLRGRKPAECGVGRETDYAVSSGQVRPEAVRCRWDAETKELVREVAQPLAQAAKMRGWLDSALEAHTAPRPESVSEAQRRRSAEMANDRPHKWQQEMQAAEVSPLDRAHGAAWGAALRGEESIALPMDQYRAAMQHYCAERVWRDPSELPHLYGVRLAVKVA